MLNKAMLIGRLGKDVELNTCQMAPRSLILVSRPLMCGKINQAISKIKPSGTTS